MTPEQHAHGIAKSTVETLVRGPKTTEFWVTTLLASLGSLLALYGVAKGNDHLVTVGGLLAGGSGSAYAVARGIAKKS